MALKFRSEYREPLLADVIAMEYGISATAVSKHLRRLLDAGFVSVRADWSNRVYRLNDHGIQVLEAEVAELREKWDERLGSGGPGDPMRAAVVAVKGTGKPSRRGFRGAGARDDPWVP